MVGAAAAEGHVVVEAVRAVGGYQGTAAAPGAPVAVAGDELGGDGRIL